MVDERTLVIRRLLVELQRSGIEPESEWYAEFVPGEGWSFHAVGDGSASILSSSSSAGTGVTSARTTKILPR